MSARYAVRDAVLGPLQALIRCALAHPALFETGSNRLERLVLPCQPAAPLEEPLRKFSETEHHQFFEAAKDGYARKTSPLIRQFSTIPPLFPGKPFQLELVFNDWQKEDTGVYLPVGIGEVSAKVGGAEFRSSSPSKLARDIVFYLEKHRDMRMDGPLSPWYFDGPPEIAEHVTPFQGLMADTEPSAISRLEAISKPVRLFLRDGGALQAGGPLSDIAVALGIKPQASRNRGVVLRV